jgi:hypothetical protein
MLDDTIKNFDAGKGCGIVPTQYWWKRQTLRRWCPLA